MAGLEKVPLAPPPRRARRGPHPHAAVGTAPHGTITCSNNAMANVKINLATTATSGEVTVAGLDVADLTVNGVSNVAGSGASVLPPTACMASACSKPGTFGTTTLTLSYSGLCALSPVRTILTSTLPPVLGPVLQADGASVGGARVADRSARYEAVQIVQ